MPPPRLLLVLLLILAAAAVGTAFHPPPAPRRPHGHVADGRTEATRCQAAKIYNADYEWKRHWWPIAFERVTDKQKPTAFELLETPLVLWWNKHSNAWFCVEDTCTHRLAPLSEGRVDESGCIECPYHGWSFEGEQGKCTKLPQLDELDDPTPPEARDAAAVPAFPTTVAQGIIWVYGTPIAELGYVFPDTATIPLCAPLEDPTVVCLDVSRDLPYSYEHLLENILDPSHVPYTHHKTIGRRQNATPVPLKLTAELTEAGFTGGWERPVATSELTRKNLDQVQRSTVFVAPSYMHHLIGTPSVSTWTVTYAVPSAPGKSRILARFPFKFNDTKPASLGSKIRRALFTKVPDWLQHLQQNTVLDDDNIFLAVQERRLASRPSGGAASWAQSYYLPTKGDLFIATFRKWVSKFGSGGPFPHATAQDLAPVDWRTPEALLDRYTQHTRHCASCSQALAAVRRWRPVVGGAGLFAATLGKALLDLALSPAKSLAVAAAVSGLLACAWWQMGRLESALLVGPYPPPRNAEDWQQPTTRRRRKKDGKAEAKAEAATK